MQVPHRDALTMREVDGEVLLLDGRTNRIHQLNRTASFIWKRCADGDADPQGIAAALVAEFDVEEAAALHDVQDALSKLRALDLLAAD